MNTCPYCKEEIKDDAVKCRYCRSVLVPDLPPQDGKADPNRVVLDFDRGLIRFGAYLAALLGVFLIVGATLYGIDLKKAHDELNSIRALNLNLETARHKTMQMVSESETNLQRTKDKTAEIDKSLEEVLNSIDSLRGGAAEGDNITNALKQGSENKADIAKNRNLIEEIRKTLTKLLAAYESLGVELENLDVLPSKSRTELSAELKESSRPVVAVEQADEVTMREAVGTLQTSRALSETETGKTSRTWYQISFEVTIKDIPTTKKYNGLEAVEKVVYNFDDRWYSNPQVTKFNRESNFRTSMRVWGSTKVKTEIFIRGLDAPEVREEMMRLR